MRFAFSLFAALLLAGCANSSLGGLGGSDSVARPKTIIVTDFVFGDGVTAIDRAYTVRLERKIGSFPPHERKPRTLERVNEEIVAIVVATLRGAGLDAQPGGPDSAAGEGAVLVSGTLRSTEPVASDSKKPKPVTDQIGFGAGRPNVVADVKVLSGRRQLMSFTAETGGGRGAPCRQCQAGGGAKRGDRHGARRATGRAGKAVAGSRRTGAPARPQRRRKDSRLRQRAGLAHGASRRRRGEAVNLSGPHVSP